LKLLKQIRNTGAVLVAPRAGAWIETSIITQTSKNNCVAPRAGAWIETYNMMCKKHPCRGRPPRGGVD